jgi:hypothetical protein
MKALKFLGFYLLILAYYLTVFAILIFTFDPSIKSQQVSPFALFISLAAIGSPFLLTDKIIDNTYPGHSKRKFAIVMLIIIMCLTVLHASGVQISGGINLMQLPFYAFNLCLIISLYRFNPKDEPKQALNTSSTIELSKAKQSNFDLVKLKAYLINIKWRLVSALSIIVFILLLTNPSLQAFKEHIGNYKNGVVSRESNFFVCGIFKFNSRRYIGVAENFFIIKPKQYNTRKKFTRNDSNIADNTSNGVNLFDTSKKVKIKHAPSNLDKELEEFIKTRRNR